MLKQEIISPKKNEEPSRNP